MNNHTAIEGLRRLVLNKHQSLVEDIGVPAPFLQLLDESGQVVSYESALAASGSQATTSSGLRSFEPKAGEGFYAQLRRQQERRYQDYLTTVWVVTGPDWEAEVTISEPSENRPWIVEPRITESSEEGIRFLSLFAQ